MVDVRSMRSELLQPQISMKYDDFKTAQPRSVAGSGVFLAAWFVCGLACISLDDFVQPVLTGLGRDGIVRRVVEQWQVLGGATGILLFLAAGLLDWRSRRGKTIWRFAMSVVVAGAAVQTLKHTVGRARPNWVDDTTVFYGPLGMFNSGSFVPTDSMPSGHTTVAFAMATALSWRWPNGRVLWFLLASGVGVSRSLVDRHFPSDVILGALVGTIVASFITRFRWRSTLALEHEAESQMLDASGARDAVC